MGTFKDAYDIVCDLIKLAKEKGNEQLVSSLIDVQVKLFELKDEIEKVKDQNKALQQELENYKTPVINEECVQYHANGFFTLKNENNKYPYCSACWRLNKRIVPLAKQGDWWKFKCPSCQTQIMVVNEAGGIFK